jgi:hypothetical protein
MYGSTSQTIRTEGLVALEEDEERIDVTDYEGYQSPANGGRTALSSIPMELLLKILFYLDVQALCVSLGKEDRKIARAVLF